jgi:hypothetical protein
MPGGGASYLKPDGERRTRHQPAFGWTLLAPKPKVRAPALPPGKWHAETRQWWKQLWGRPQAVMWDPTGITLTRAARLYEAIVSGGDVARLSAELRQIEDRHGLKKAMLQLRWRVGDPGDLDDEAAEPVRAKGRATSAEQIRRRRLLRSVKDAG